MYEVCLGHTYMLEFLADFWKQGVPFVILLIGFEDLRFHVVRGFNDIHVTVAWRRRPMLQNLCRDFVHMICAYTLAVPIPRPPHHLVEMDAEQTLHAMALSTICCIYDAFSAHRNLNDYVRHPLIGVGKDLRQFLEPMDLS